MASGPGGLPAGLGQDPAAPEARAAPRPGSPAPLPLLTRRRFLRRMLQVSAGASLLGAGYALGEAGWYRVTRDELSLPQLPGAFAGLRIAFLSDLHHGPYTGLEYIRQVVASANELRPDLVCLGGDYVHRGGQYIAPCIAALGRLRAPLGCFAVLGNHDHWHDAPATRRAFQAAAITDLTNRGIWLSRGDQRLRLCGVGDLWEDVQDLEAALGAAAPGESAILLSHNPDFAETVRDPRVGLVLSGHTHGGQVSLPFMGAPLLPSRYGQKYRYGLVRNGPLQVLVSSGLGTISPPLRLGCRPELNLVVLGAAF